MRNILFLVLIITINQAKASKYYFSSISGDNLRTPMQAKNPATPWKTLEKLNSFFSNLNPGDSVLLKRGETFYGYFTVSKSGTANLPIIIAAYGSGKNPVITGFTPLTWTFLGNNIYESQVLTPAYINVLTVNGSITAMGRYPNSGYLILDSHNGISDISDNELTGTPNWTGAELVLRCRRWIMDRDSIINHTGNTISYRSWSKYAPIDKFGYFIQNSPLSLDKQNEWYYNSGTKKIWLYSTSAPKKVNVATIDDLIISSGNSYITFDNITIEGANKIAVRINSGSNINMNYCDILFSGESGVKVVGHKNFKMDNCTVSNSLNNGIDLGSTSGYSILRNNTIKNTSVLAGMGIGGDLKGIGIYTTSRNNLIEYNNVINTGYIGIYFSGDSVIIKNNFIDSFCTVKDDGAGIHSYIGSAAPRKGRKVIGNIIMNGIGAAVGTNDINDPEASGIYMDLNTSDVEISGNTVTTCNNFGMYIHGASGLIIKNNTLFDNHIQLSLIEKTGRLIRNNIITQNVFFSKLPTQLVSSLKSGVDDIDLFGKFDSNYYVKPLNNKLVIYNKYLNNGGNISSQNSEIQDWKEKYGKDETLKGIAAARAVSFNPDYTTRFEYNATKINKTILLNGRYVDTKNNKYVNRIILQPYTSIILIKQK